MIVRVFAFLCLLCTASFALAQETPTAEKPASAPINAFVGGEFAPANFTDLQPRSGQEALLISFYRNSGVTPDFKRWSYQTDKAKKAADYDRAVIALNEQVRLQTAYQNADPAGLLIVDAPLDVSRYSATQEILFLPTFAYGGLLTQSVFGEKMAIVVPDLRKFQALHMPNAEAGEFFRAVTKGGTSTQINSAVIAEMILKPRRAIFHKEGRAGKNDHYLFTLDLAQLTIWAKSDADVVGHALWTWRASWYKPDMDNPQLLQLYKAIN